MDTLRKRRRLIVCVDGALCASEAKRGSQRCPSTISSVFAGIAEGSVTDDDGTVWLQEKYYDKGLGTLESLGSLSQAHVGGWQELIRNVYKRSCTLDEQDHVWFFGFGRGAYVVRAVAGLLHHIGKLKASSTSTFNNAYVEALTACQTTRRNDNLDKTKINLHHEAEIVSPPIVRFVGAFDTVKAVPDDGPFDVSFNPSIQNFRHALALHEDKKRLSPVTFMADETSLESIYRSGRGFVQAWFVGAHVDIGGSLEGLGLSLYPLQWMLIEAQKLGLQLQLHRNARCESETDDPLQLIFSTEEQHGKRPPMWYCTTSNHLQIEMQDLRSLHNSHQHYASRYKVKVTRDRNPMWTRQPRAVFGDYVHPPAIESPSQMLLGYCETMPLGTIIHPSVYCLMDYNLDVVMDSKQKALVQNLSEWSFRMLGEIELTFNGTTRKVANPGFWTSHSEDSKISVSAPLRILVCGSTGVGKSTLISKGFGVNLNSLSERICSVQKEREETRIPEGTDFILHDSKGFDNGSDAEVEEVQAFIRERVEANDVQKQLHVIWFCIEAGSRRIVDTHTEQLFRAIATVKRHLSVVVVATKKDIFVNEQIQLLKQDGVDDIQLCKKVAREKLHERAAMIEAQITAFEGCRVSSVVCVDKDDMNSVAELLKISSDVFNDDQTRLLYASAQIARPDLKIHLAIHDVMHAYKNAVQSAAGAAFIPFGPAGSYRICRNDMCRRIFNCFGVRNLDSTTVLDLLQQHIQDALPKGRAILLAQALAVRGATPVRFAMTIPFFALRYAVGAYIITPAAAQLFLCTACDIILVTARSFQSASSHNRSQPNIEDVEMAIRALKEYACDIHQQICELVPRNNAFRSFSYAKIHVKFEALTEEYWRKLGNDAAQIASASVLAHGDHLVSPAHARPATPSLSSAESRRTSVSSITLSDT